MFEQLASWYMTFSIVQQLIMVAVFTLVTSVILSVICWIFTEANYVVRYLFIGCIAVTVLYFMGLV